MIRAFLLQAGFAATALAADWRAQVTAPAPGTFPLPRALHADYRCGWAALNAGNLEANFTRKGEVAQLSVKAGTAGFVRTLWRMDATHVARAHTSTLLPIDMRQMEFYRGKTLRTDLDFTAQNVTKFREWKPDDATPPKRKRFDYPNLFDLHTALLFVRSQRLKEGDTLNLVIYPATAPYLATIRVLGREWTQVKAGRYAAIKLDVRLQRINQKFELEPHSKFKRATAWLSDDADRILLKAQADIFVGSVWVELNEVKFAAPAATGS